MKYKLHFIKMVVYGMIFIWSIIMLGVACLFVYENYEYADTLAKNEALISVKKDLAYRSWVASHGGVYVPITEKTPPNPYLSHVKDRDVNTTSNMQLTLMNGAYTLSQMMEDYRGLYGTKGHITSLILTNPVNKPDSWEEKVLQEVAITKKDISKKAIINGEEYFRYLKPLVTQQSCLKCHGHQGYKVGDIRGGVSVSIPLKGYYEQAYSQTIVNISVIFMIYILGLSVIIYGRKKAHEILDNKIKDYEQHIFSLVNIIEERDSYTAGHTQRVAQYSVLIAEEMGFNDEKIDDMHRACMLHDIGKISTPDSILLKPGKLTPLEYDIIKEHVVVSYELLCEVDIYKDIADIIRHHHEHYDGSGYPQGLKGDEIPLMSQIMTVADSFDAMTTNRIYKSRKSVPLAIEELKALAGKQFHGEVVRAASIALEDMEVETTITQRPKSKIEKERFSYFYKDQVTGAYNKDYLEFVLAYNHADEFNANYLSCIYLHNFSHYNKENSWEEGDKFLKNIASQLNAVCNEDFVFRIYGDHFIILKENACVIEDYISAISMVLEGTGVTSSHKSFGITEEKIVDISVLESLL